MLRKRYSIMAEEMREALERALGGHITLPPAVRIEAIFAEFYPCSAAADKTDLDEIALHIAEKHLWDLHHHYGLTITPATG